MDWQKLYSEIGHIRIVFVFFGLNSAFFAGVVFEVGWNFFPIMNKVDLSAFVISVMLISIVVASIGANFLLLFWGLFIEDTKSNQSKISNNSFLKLIFGSNDLSIIIWVSVFLSLWFFFLPKESEFKYLAVYSEGTIGLLFLTLGLAFSFLILGGSVDEIREKKRSSSLGVVFMMFGALSLGSWWIHYMRIYPKKTMVVLQTKTGENYENIFVNILFPAGQGILVYAKGKEVVTYLSWSSIRKMEVVKGLK